MKDDLNFDITIEQGSDYPLDVTYTDNNGSPTDFTGWVVRSEIRQDVSDPHGIPFICSADDEGIHLRLSSARSMQLAFSSGVYDVFITDPEGQTRTRLISGKVQVIPNVSRNVR